VVLAVFAVLQLTVLSHSSGHNPAAASLSTSATAQAAPKGPMPAQMFPDALFKKLTKDIQANNEQAFLSLVAPSARPAVQTWWENMKAIGFSTGAIMPDASNDQVNVNSDGDGTATVLAGTHSALDPVERQKPDIPLEKYQLGLHFSSAKATGEITTWKPLGDDPWDQGKLYVAKAANVIVAGPAAESALVQETLPIAQAAAAYDVGLIDNVNPNDRRQQGFVVFVSNNPGTRSGWLAGTKQPSGWPPAFFGGYTAQLPGPGASAGTSFSLGGGIDDVSTGGARVVITPYEDQSNGTSHMETAELVHQFALDILADENQPLFGASATVPSWAMEGFAVALQVLYEQDTNPTPGSYSFAALNDGLAKLPASYLTGHLPTSAELYKGTLATEESWNEVAASVYSYIATKYGMNQLLASADLMWTQDAEPFGNVLQSNSGGTLTFYSKDTIESGWKTAIASPSTLAITASAGR
jgi:hypothetical protein